MYRTFSKNKIWSNEVRRCKGTAKYIYNKSELPVGSYSIPDTQNYFKYILKKHGKKPVSPPIKIYISIIENRIMFKIKTGYYLELLTPKAMKLLGSTKRKITKDKNGEKVPYLEITEVVLIYFNIVNNSYQENSRVV